MNSGGFTLPDGGREKYEDIVLWGELCSFTPGSAEMWGWALERSAKPFEIFSFSNFSCLFVILPNSELVHTIPVYF